MNLNTNIANEYINNFGDDYDKVAFSIYEEHLADKDILKIKRYESLSFGLDPENLVLALLFLLATISNKIIEDGYEVSKKLILKYLKDRKTKPTQNTDQKICNIFLN